MEYTILLVEDELSLLNILKAYFIKNNYNIFTATNGLDALEIFNKEDINIIVTDVLMPQMDGWEIVAEIRKNSNVPIILMTALSSEEDQLKGFSLNIDNYITKPFSPQILIAKVNSLVKRYFESNTMVEITTYGCLKINRQNRLVYTDDIIIQLSQTEYELLIYLVNNINEPQQRVQILDEVWGLDVYVEERVIDTFIKTLRKKLGNSGKYIKTVFGYGYKFEVNDDK